MVLDIVIPIQFKQFEHLEGCLDSLVETTDVPFRVITSVSGGPSKGLAAFRDVLSAYPFRWLNQHQQKHPNSYNAAVSNGLRVAESKFVAVVPASYRLLDDKWFGKMQSPLLKDPVGVVSWTADYRSHPFRGQPKEIRGEKLFLTRNPALKELFLDLEIGSDYLFEIATKAVVSGGFGWCVPGVRFSKIDDETAWTETRTASSSHSG